MKHKAVNILNNIFIEPNDDVSSSKPIVIVKSKKIISAFFHEGKFPIFFLEKSD